MNLYSWFRSVIFVHTFIRGDRMAGITIQEFNYLKPKEIRDYFGLDPVSRIIKYILEGQANHRMDAVRTISYWLKYQKVSTERNEIVLLSYAVPFLFKRFPEENRNIRTAIAAALHFFVKTDAILDEHFVKTINEFMSSEEDPNIRRKLRSVLSWNQLNIRHTRHSPTDQIFYITLQASEALEIISGLEVYKYPLHYKPKPQKKIIGNTIQCVYFLQEKDNGYVKIGKTKNLKTKSFFPYLMPFKWEIIHTIESNDVNSLEKYFHRIFRDKNINGEWFKLDKQDIENIMLFNTQKHQFSNKKKMV